MRPMFSFCRKLAVFALIACLPLQNLHAVSMPLCTQDQDTTAASHQHADDVDVAGHDHESTASDNDLDCDGCCLCHACSAPAIASAGIDVLLDFVQTSPPALTSHVSLFAPEQLQRPPSQFLV